VLTIETADVTEVGLTVKLGFTQHRLGNTVFNFPLGDTGELSHGQVGGYAIIQVWRLMVAWTMLVQLERERYRRAGDIF
jgi:hypothetical protein